MQILFYHPALFHIQMGLSEKKELQLDFTETNDLVSSFNYLALTIFIIKILAETSITPWTR